MTKVIADITMSLDGFVTGPGADAAHGLGIGGEPLHDWVTASDDPVDAEVLQDATERSGAVIMGRNVFDVIDGPDGWGDDMGYGAGHAATPPFFVVTHQPPSIVRLGLDFTFVTDGVAAAVAQARVAAGEKDVVIMGGGSVIRQGIEQGLVEELVLHLAPVVLGGGTPLFGAGHRRLLTQQQVRPSAHATHVTYAVGG